RVGGLQRTGVRRAVAGRGRGRVGGSGKRSHVAPRKRAGKHEPGTYRERQRRKRGPNAGSLLADRAVEPGSGQGPFSRDDFRRNPKISRSPSASPLPPAPAGRVMKGLRLRPAAGTASRTRTTPGSRRPIPRGRTARRRGANAVSAP